MFRRRTIPPENREAARQFVLSAMEASRPIAQRDRYTIAASGCESQEGGGWGGQITYSPTYTAPVPTMKRHELRRIRQMMLDIYGV